MTKIHLDTDIGGDMDDVCALTLYEIPDRDGMPTRLVTKIDGNAFKPKSYAHSISFLLYPMLYDSYTESNSAR